MSSELLFSLLDKNKISIHEFHFKLKDNKQEFYVIWYKNIKNSFYAEDIQSLSLLKKEIPVSSPFYFVLELLIKKLNMETINLEETNKIKNMLLSINRWTEYYILIFLLVIKILTVRDLTILFGYLLNKIEDNDSYKLYEKDIILSLLNMIEACLEENAISEAKYFLSFLPQIMTDPFYLFERTMLEFYSQFILAVEKKDKDKPIKKCYNIINIFKKYNMLSIVNELDNLMKQYGF